MNMEVKINENGKETEQAPGGTGDGDKPKANTKIDNANLAAERMENATKELKEQNDRSEQIAIDRKLGGETEGGVEAPVVSKLTDEEQASRDRIKALGLASGAQWAKNMDKEDNGE